MKYDIIKTDNWLVIVDDSEIKEGDLVLSRLYQVIPFGKNFTESLYRKVIAHLPINNSPILEGVDLLPPLEQEDGTYKLFQEDSFDIAVDDFNAYKSGYNKAKEKYKWTDEDVINIVEKSRETGLTAEYLMLSLFQPKYPITFECEMEEVIIGGFIDGKDEAVTLEKENKPKTTTNSQGQTILVGKYIY